MFSWWPSIYLLGKQHELYRFIQYLQRHSNSEFHFAKPGNAKRFRGLIWFVSTSTRWYTYPKHFGLRNSIRMPPYEITNNLFFKRRYILQITFCKIKNTNIMSISLNIYLACSLNNDLQSHPAWVLMFQQNDGMKEKIRIDMSNKWLWANELIFHWFQLEFSTEG